MPKSAARNALISLEPDVLDVLMPMHLTLDPEGRILKLGPTLQKMGATKAMVGKGFLDVFEMVRPRRIVGVEDLWSALGEALHLRLRSGEKTNFRAVALPVASDDAIVLVNMSFGIHVGDAVASHDLTVEDFAATDLAVEMLYLMEAKSAAMGEARRLIGRLDDAKKHAEVQSVTDTLTGLPNRRALEKYLERAGPGQFGCGVMLIDLDFFKNVNDTYGHAVGDEVLFHAAQRIRAETRGQDFVARVGGDEFLVIVGDVSDPESVRATADRIIASVSQTIRSGGVECAVGVSIGVSMWIAGHARSFAEIQEAADVALYEAKRLGRRQVAFDRGVATTVPQR